MDDNELQEKAQALLEAGHAYFNVMRKKGLAGGCIWLTGVGGEMVIFTRGEYRHQLLHNIEMEIDAKRTYSFGTAELPGDEKG